MPLRAATKRCHPLPFHTPPPSTRPPASNSLSTGSNEVNPKRGKRAQRRPGEPQRARKSRWTVNQIMFKLEHKTYTSIFFIFFFFTCGCFICVSDLNVFLLGLQRGFSEVHEDEGKAGTDVHSAQMCSSFCRKKSSLIIPSVV